MNDRSNNYSTHSDLLVQVADSAEEDAHVRRVLGGRVSEAELDEHEQWRRAPHPVGATNHAHRYSRCASGPCAGGTRPCPTAEACQCEDEARAAGGRTERLAVWTLLAALWAAIVFTLLAT